jgi:hypothetical protein
MDKLYSFDLLEKPAYGHNSQTWLEWLDTPDYLEWSAKKGITLTCASASSNVITSDGKAISYLGVAVTGSSAIVANYAYSKVTI